MQLWRGQQQELDYVEAERGWEIARLRSHLGCTKQLSWMNSITVDLQLLEEEPMCKPYSANPRYGSHQPVAAKSACLFRSG